MPPLTLDEQGRDPTHHAVGDVVAERYRLEKRIGCGGEGVVFRAHDRVADRPVAVKLLLPGPSITEDAQRLETEARMQAEFAHPCIARAIDFARTEGGGACLAMELLEGQTLCDLLESCPALPATDAVRMLLPVIEAMCFVHGRGVIHLDLKPENIFITATSERPQPKILDFGIARRFDQPKGADLTGTVSGSPGYMSPEQAQGLDLDARADVWALCVVLYEMISGVPAFPRSTCRVNLRAVVEDAVRPLSDLSASAASLWPILERGLEKDRERRFQSMHDLGRALAGWLRARGWSDDVCGNDLAESWQLDTSAENPLPPCGSRRQPLARTRRWLQFGFFPRSELRASQRRRSRALRTRDRASASAAAAA